MSQSVIRILLVEDNATNRTFISLYLRRKGHIVEEACNGFEALELLSEKHFDVVFMDVQMPGLDGIEATKQIRKNNSANYNSNIPIIAMTAYTMKGDKEFLLEAGMDCYISKPIELEQLAILTEKWAHCKKKRDIAQNRKDVSSQSGSCNF